MLDIHKFQNGELEVSITDNVLDPEDWPVSIITVENGIVVAQRTKKEGCYSMDDMMGWNMFQLEEWHFYDTTGHHPEQYYEVEPVK